MRFVVMFLSFALAGCATESSILIVSQADRQIANGTVDWLAQHAIITINGRNYQGDYILNPSPLPQTTVIINNSDSNKKDGARSTTSTPRSKNGSGKMLLVSNEGDALSCEFSYEESIGMKAIGSCTDAAKHVYDLQISTAF